MNVYNWNTYIKGRTKSTSPVKTTDKVCKYRVLYKDYVIIVK